MDVAIENIIGVLRNRQIGKAAMGVTVTASLIPFGMAGAITGRGPKDKNERSTLTQKGWRQNSLIIGDFVLPYQNLGPLSGILSMIGNMSDAIKYNNDDEATVNKLLQDGLLNFMTTETEQSFMTNINGVLSLFSGGNYKTPDQILRTLAVNAIPIPQLWTQTLDLGKKSSNYIFDTEFKESINAQTLTEEIQKRIWPFGENMRPNLNAFGENTSTDLIWGLTPKFINNDDTVINFMDKNNVFIGRPSITKITVNGEKRKMTPKEHNEYIEKSGKAVYKRLKSLIDSGSLDGLTEEQLKKTFRSISSAERKRVKFEIQSKVK